MSDFTYDVLLAYARADAAWVHKTLLLRLKTEGLRVFDDTYWTYNVPVP